ncbi:hypothetical protein OIU77_010915 [Salix suchowensis]|uniref:Uncharacterized protein n=1 Tax=Salix suchowensis TaxID=1278906 RepID=A0ABQ9AC77_9ROSI|nr:hypothetical protein OIU77_010915 [Salix suchowensis]
MPQQTISLDPTSKPQGASGDPTRKGTPGAPIANLQGCNNHPLEKKQADQTATVEKETLTKGSGDQATKKSEKGQEKEEDDSTSHIPQASTSTKPAKAPCIQDMQKCVAPQLSQEDSSSSDKAATELQEKGKWPSDDEDIMSKSKGKAPAISEPIPSHSPVKVKKKKGGKKKQEARGL